MDFSSAITLTHNTNIENLSDSVEQSENEINCVKETTNINISKINDHNGSQIKESFLISEHSYANLNNKVLNKNFPNNMLCLSKNDQSKQNQNNYILKEESINKNNEISITEEIITIDGCSYSTEENTNKNNIKNINLDDEIISSNGLSDLCFIDKNTSLGAIALEYDSSDSEDDTNTLKKVPHSDIYRNMDETTIKSDDSFDSESDSSSSDSESDSDSSISEIRISDKNSNDDSDDEIQVKSKGNRQKIFESKGEFDDLPPIEDLKISVPEVLCDPLGEVAWMVEQMVVVRPKPGKPTLNLDTVLFIDKGQRALGHIFDVFGQVTEPHYCVRFNSSEHIQKCDIKVGMTVYFCPNTEYTSLVFLHEITKMKAVDDVGEDETPEFSDDEEEQAYLNSLKNKSNENAKKKESPSVIPNKRRRCNNLDWQSSHPWNSNHSYQQQSIYAQTLRPFYRSHHPWSHHRYLQQNPWHQYNSFPNNHWITRFPSHNHRQSLEMQTVRFPSAQWNSNYQWSEMNTVPNQGFSQTLVPPLTIPPPPPPPPPPPSSSSDT